MQKADITVELLDCMGTDLTVVNAARVSFNKKSEFEKGENGKDALSVADAKLIRYLAREGHWTPFAHASTSFLVKAPIFVSRQLVKHTSGLVINETSRRYVDTAPEYFLPKTLKQRPEGSIKQGAGEVHYYSQDWLDAICQHTEDSISFYNDLIGDGVAPEQARMALPLNIMTEWWWTGSLAAWARVCKLRLDDHAQEETREVAKLIDAHMVDLFPVSWKVLMEVK